MLKRTKGFVSLVAAIALMLGLCSCSGKPETDPSTTADPTGIGAQAETGENTTAKDIVPESGAPETAAEEANTAKEAGTAAVPNRYVALCGPFVLFFLMHLIASALQKEKFSPTNTILPDILPSFGFLFLYQAVLSVLGCAAFIFFARRRLLQ